MSDNEDFGIDVLLVTEPALQPVRSVAGCMWFERDHTALSFHHTFGSSRLQQCVMWHSEPTGCQSAADYCPIHPPHEDARG
jgi:hypothetical protein